MFSTLVGAGRAHEAPRYGLYGIMIALLGGLAAAASLPLIAPALGLTNFEPSVQAAMTTYMQLRLWATAPILAQEAIANYYGGQGKTWVSMVAGLVSMVVNVSANWIFIDGNWGAPALGIRGAALSSVLAAVAALGLVLLLYVGDLRRAVPGALKPRWDELRRVVRFGLPSGVNWFLEFAAFQLFVNTVLSGLGTTTSAAFNTVMSVNSLSFMPAFGLASAGAILAGQAIGNQQPHRVWPALRLTMLTTMAWMGVVGMAYVIWPRELIGLFQPPGSGPNLVNIGASMLLLSAGWQLFDAMGMTLAETLRAAGDTTWTAGARLLLAWGVFMPVAYLVVVRMDGGPNAAMVCLGGYLLLLAAALGYRFRKGRWRQFKLVEPSLV